MSENITVSRLRHIKATSFQDNPILYLESRLPSNKGMLRTALCADKIVAILKVRISTIAFPI
jgi:hypothetical protein